MLNETPPAKPSEPIPVRALIAFAIFTLILPGVVFLAAGTVRWPMGWVYYGLTAAAALLSRVAVALVQPSLLAERARSQRAEDVKPWDRTLSLVVGLVAPTLNLVVAGLDKRWSWSPPPPSWVAPLAIALFVLAYSFATWAMVANRFFSSVVRIQEERGHHVVSEGPYRIVRHPGYVGGVVAAIATPLLLGSLWGLISAAVYTAFVVLRTALEDRTLHEELPGYREYAQRTRYRLLPGVW
jgi:protein-S-isoprenylcysteine O-methyltransferase Ste14